MTRLFAGSCSSRCSPEPRRRCMTHCRTWPEGSARRPGIATPQRIRERSGGCPGRARVPARCPRPEPYRSGTPDHDLLARAGGRGVTRRSSVIDRCVVFVGLTGPMATALIMDSAEQLSQDLLGDFPSRWKRSVAVARRAQRLADRVPLDEEGRRRLIAAAWLHDIGHSPGLRRSGFPPLDAARHLERLAWPSDVTTLVAHHSGARFVAQELGLSCEAQRHPFTDDLASDLLTYADQTVGPHGSRLKVEDRIQDMLTRHGPYSPNARAHHVRGPYVLQVAERVRALLTRWD